MPSYYVCDRVDHGDLTLYPVHSAFVFLGTFPDHRVCSASVGGIGSDTVDIAFFQVNFIQDLDVRDCIGIKNVSDKRAFFRHFHHPPVASQRLLGHHDPFFVREPVTRPGGVAHTGDHHAGSLQNIVDKTCAIRLCRPVVCKPGRYAPVVYHNARVIIMTSFLNNTDLLFCQGNNQLTNCAITGNRFI